MAASVDTRNFQELDEANKLAAASRNAELNDLELGWRVSEDIELEAVTPDGSIVRSRIRQADLGRLSVRDRWTAQITQNAS